MSVMSKLDSVDAGWLYWIAFTCCCYLYDAGNEQDDLVLVVIMLVGTVCNDDACAKMLAQAGIIQSLIELLNGNLHS